MAVTENNPTIKPYDEKEWAELESGRTASIKPSIKLIKILHEKWIDFLFSLTEEDLLKGYHHPTLNRIILLPEAIALYAWHSEHHLAHIRIVTKGGVDLADFAKKTEPVPNAGDAPKRGPGRPKSSTPEPEKTSSDTLNSDRRPGRPKSEPKPSEDTTTQRRRGRPKRLVTEPVAPKLSREEVLAKARAARAAKAAAEGKPAKAPKSSDTPKLSREEVLAKARAARAAKAPKTK